MQTVVRTLWFPTMVAALACSACASPGLPAELSKFAVEEHRLQAAPKTDPLSFLPVDGSMESVLAIHADQRLKRLRDSTLVVASGLAMQVRLGSDELTAWERYDPTSARSWVAVSKGGQELYRIDTGIPSPISGLQGFWTYDDHWVLETAHFQADGARGRLTEDGALLVPHDGYTEAFSSQPLHGHPFYFFRRGDRVGLSYNGVDLPGDYDEVLHFECCSASVLNPVHSQDMLAFFARRGGTWYYVEAGVFN